MSKLPKEPKSKNPKKRKVVSEKRDPTTGYGMSSRSSRPQRSEAGKKSVRRLKTEDVLNTNTSNQYKMKRAADTVGITKIGKY